MAKKKFDRKPVSVAVTGVYSVSYDIDGEIVVGHKISYAEYNSGGVMVGVHLDKCSPQYVEEAECMIGEFLTGSFAFDRNGRVTCFVEDDEDEDDSNGET